MKSALFFTLLLSGLLSGALAYSATSPAQLPKSYSFHFTAPKSKTFAIITKAVSKEQAYKLAATECYNKLTGNKYPGEEKGLEIIDICANPKM